MVFPENAGEVIESGQLAHFATINGSGTPHVTIVWVGLERDEIVIGKLYEDHKLGTSAEIHVCLCRSRRRRATSAA